MILPQNYIGIDVSKAHLDVFSPRTGQSRLVNQPVTLAGFAASLDPGDIVVLEATGRYGQSLRAALGVAGIGHVRVNPLRARDFARALGQLAKTDALDARMLSRMGQALALAPQPAPDATRLKLTALVRRHDQLVAIRAREANHGETADPAITESIARHTQWLDHEIEAIEHQIRALIAADQTLDQHNKRLRSVPGIGPVAATTLLALLPELGTRPNKAIAALAGLAPLNRDSGTMRGLRRIGPGRKRVRMALYMAALSATRCCPRFRACYQALRQRGKPAKLALIAVARKLIVTINAMARTQTMFTP